MINKERVYSREQPRILFFVHDGAGLGHLRRISRIAHKLQGRCACLIVTGHRTAGWVVPHEVEFVHIPSMETTIKSKAEYWGRVPFVNMSGVMATEFRKKLLRGVIDAFQPDAFVLDYLPIGKRKEFREILAETDALKYFVLRGVIGTNREQYENVFENDAGLALRRDYDRIVVAADPRICDVVDEYKLPKEMADKVTYVGYVGDEVSQEQQDEVRRHRGLGPNDKWVVCSVGGGKDGEAIIEESFRVGQKLAARGVFVDVVVGPRSKLASLAADQEILRTGRLRWHRECSELPLYHAACDVVVGAGGYNTFVEALGGRASYICNPIERKGDDEQEENAKRLGAFFPGRIILRSEPSRSLAEDVETLLERGPQSGLAGAGQLTFTGASRFRDLMLGDFGPTREPTARYPYKRA